MTLDLVALPMKARAAQDMLRGLSPRQIARPLAGAGTHRRPPNQRRTR